jgi:cytochrome P450
MNTRLIPTQCEPTMPQSTNVQAQALASQHHNPPGPKRHWWGLPLLRAMRADYLGFVSRLHREHGDITYMHLGSERAYDVFSPELVRAVLVDQADQLVRWERGMEVFEQVFGQSVLVTEGRTWQRQRRMLQPAFTPRRVAGYATLMIDAAQEALDAAVPVNQPEALVDMDALFTRVTMDVILRTLFGSRAPRDASNASTAVQVLSECAMREMFWPMTLPDWLPLPGKAAKRYALRTLRELVGRHIQARQVPDPQAPSQDLLGLLLALRDEETGAALSQAEVFDQCMVSFQAGHETTATALLWWSRLLAGHPVVARRVQQEVDTLLAGRTPEPQDMPALPWLTASLKEAMRLYPPVAAIMTRRTTQALVLDGWTIPRRALVRITPWVVQRDPRSFEDPEAFRPERFLPDAPPLPRGAWMPFGAGPRVCIGQHFAMLEMSLVAVLLLQRYALELPVDAPACQPLFNVTLRPKGGVRLHLRRRC